MVENTGAKECLVCHKSDGDTPLISLVYRDSPLWICPEHMPVLIHNPDKLAGTLPGAEHLTPGEHHD